MNIDFFKLKFESKSNEELEEIAKNNLKYVFEARTAAMNILKARNVSSQLIIDIEKELISLQNHKNFILKDEFLINEKILTELEKISINKNKKYKLDNGNVLQIRRFNKQLFQISIEHSRSYISPVVICIIDKERQCKYFPFLNMGSILICIVIGLSIIGFSYFQNNFVSENLIQTLCIPVIFFICIQIIMAPFMYSRILETFKKQIKIRNVS